MMREKTFVLTIATSGTKADWIDFMTKILTTTMKAMNGFRKCYHAHLEEVTDADKENVECIVNAKLMRKLRPEWAKAVGYEK